MPPVPKAALTSAPHLATWILPAWLNAALGELGQREVLGKGSNPRIIEYRKIAGLAGMPGVPGMLNMRSIQGDDSDVPWCAIFINAMLAKAEVKTSGSAMARGFVKHGDFERLAKPMVGCITVISSSRGPASGHVFFYTGETFGYLQGCGGNQNDAVTLSQFPKSKLVGHFWPKGQPKLPAPYDKPVLVAGAGSEGAVRDA